MKVVKILLVLSVLLFNGAVQAKLNGKNVILVHGFISKSLLEPLDLTAEKREASQEWEEFWLSKAEYVIHWPSAERIEGGVKDRVRKQIKELETDGICREGCVIVTHSTGDLVTRHMLSRLNQWGIDPDKFSVVATFDLAGAGGGSEVADQMYNIAMGTGVFDWIQQWAMQTFAGYNLTPETIGAVADVRPAIARSIANENGPTPRLRFVGTGNLFGGFSNLVITGYNDGSIPLHSACGASDNEWYKSCSGSIRANGEIRSTAYAPESLMFNHYPVLMGSEVNHQTIKGDKPSGHFAPVINNTAIGALDLDFATTITTRNIWSLGCFLCKVRFRKTDNKKSMSRLIYETLDE